MRRKIWKAAGILTLSFVLGVGMAGCAGEGAGEPDDQSVTLQDSDGMGGGGEPDAPDSQSGVSNSGAGTGDGSEIKDGGEVEGDSGVGNNVGAGGSTESVYFEGADLNGRVLEFSDTGFTITPVHREVFEDGTSSSWEAAPGKEKEEDNIYVTYTEDTGFEAVYFNRSMQEVSSREDADKSGIKKETMVYVFGSSEDGKHWTADKVLIQRWDDGKKKGVFYDGADLSGRVVGFSDTGCTITPRTLIINEDGSMEGGIAAPGYESEETNINITYAEDAAFQIIYFSMGTQVEISREDTDKNSVKKETDVNIFGTCQDEKHWIADKVVITRWQNN